MADNSADRAALDRFQAFLREHGYNRSSELSYWVDAYLRDDGKDMYGRSLGRR